MRTVFRYEIPVDDRVHTIPLTGLPLAVGCRAIETVEFWAIHDDDASVFVPHDFIVIGTGHPLPPGDWLYVGTAIPNGRLVWHLFRRSPGGGGAA